MTAASARYRILRRLGQGGMAEVFEAELVAELGFSRKVAIKRMLAAVAHDGESARRFLDEARIASKLHHANIVAIVDFGLLDGLPFQVLELVDGIDVHGLMGRAGGVLPVDVALILAGGVAHALDHAHTATGADGMPLGIVHRDVKPSNVLVSWGGDVKLTDFGIALAHDRSAKTEAGFVPGTLGFISPEQRTRSTVDGRSDVFALGLTLHAFVTGYTPLRDVTAEVALLAGTPIPLDPALPDDLKRVIARAVAPARLDRPTAAQLADEIGAALVRRLDRDPRGRLRQFLETLRERAPKPGLLDQLLAFDVVASEQTPGDDGVARYELRPTVLEKPAPRDPGASFATTQKVADDTTREPEERRRRRWPLIAAAIVVGGGVGAGAWRLTGRGEKPALDAAAVAAAPADASVPADAPAVTAVAVAPAPADAAIGDAPRVAHAHDARVVADARAPEPTGTGYLQVVGEDNVGAKVVVDGSELGYAPNKLEVSRGHHRVEIVRKDGTRLTHDIDVTDYNTVAHPARPTF